MPDQLRPAQLLDVTASRLDHDGNVAHDVLDDVLHLPIQTPVHRHHQLALVGDLPHAALRGKERTGAGLAVVVHAGGKDGARLGGRDCLDFRNEIQFRNLESTYNNLNDHPVSVGQLKAHRLNVLNALLDALVDHEVEGLDVRLGQVLQRLQNNEMMLVFLNDLQIILVAYLRLLSAQVIPQLAADQLLRRLRRYRANLLRQLGDERLVGHFS